MMLLCNDWWTSYARIIRNMAAGLGAASAQPCSRGKKSDSSCRVGPSGAPGPPGLKVLFTSLMGKPFQLDALTRRVAQMSAQEPAQLPDT